MGQPNDHELWALAQKGDAAAFGTIYARHARSVQAFAIWRSDDPSQAEDITSVVFLEAWRRRRNLSLDPDLASAKPLLLGITINVVRGHARSARRHAAAVARMSRAGEVAGHEDRSLERLTAERQVRELRTKLRGLPAGELDVLAVVAWGDLTYDEAATALGIPVGTVRSRLSRARARLVEEGVEHLARLAEPRSPEVPAGASTTPSQGAVR